MAGGLGCVPFIWGLLGIPCIIGVSPGEELGFPGGKGYICWDAVEPGPTGRGDFMFFWAILSAFVPAFLDLSCPLLSSIPSLLASSVRHGPSSHPSVGVPPNSGSVSAIFFLLCFEPNLPGDGEGL